MFKILIDRDILGGVILFDELEVNMKTQEEALSWATDQLSELGVPSDLIESAISIQQQELLLERV